MNIILECCTNSKNVIEKYIFVYYPNALNLETALVLLSYGKHVKYNCTYMVYVFDM